MIPLLDRIAALEAEGRPVVGPRTAALLEWPRVTAQIASFCLNGMAASAVRSRLPGSQPEALAAVHGLSDEMRTLLAGDQPLPVIDVGQALAMLEQAAPFRLEGADLVHIAAVAEDMDAFRSHLLERRPDCPVWGEAAVQTATFAGMAGAIRRSLDPDGRISDGASPLLGRLRREVGGRERAVRQEVAAVMTRARAAGWTDAGEAALRGDRFCIPLRSGDKARLTGIVHDRSATGATLFVEPASVVALANALTETRLEIAAEEARILFQLNRAVEQARPALSESAALILLADEIRAVVRWSAAVGGSRPHLDRGGRLRISGGRHPLLVEALGLEAGRRGGSGAEPGGAACLEMGLPRVVPLDLEIPPQMRALVISGPNAGGKSVALKTVGVFCLLAQCGWDVPARGDTILPVVTRLLADLGDDQSISAALSSFSAHLRHLRRFLDLAGEGVLVLSDEIGSGTDPQEGTALAFAVLEQLIAKGTRVLASTHFGLLKAAVHDHPAMLNAAMDYDDKSLRPLFTLRAGDPGTSHAFDIAAQMGFGPDLLDRARAMAGEERVQVEQLLADLDRRAREMQETQRTLSLERDRLQVQNRELEQRLAGIRKERREVLDRSRREADKLVKEGRRAIEQAVREIRSGGADKAVVKNARQRIEDLAPADDGLPASVPFSIAVGQRVRIPHLNLIGRVVEVRGSKLVALSDGLRLTLGIGAVLPLEGEPDPESPAGDQPRPVVGVGSWSWHQEAPAAPPEIDLRGELGAEAWDRLDKLIDRAIPMGLGVLNVIHGFGSGRLRDHLHARLKADPRVASFEEAGPGQGGGGATRVFLVD